MEKTVEEIVRYCREENTYGALLLCGDWGTGKTYLLEHDAADQLRDVCVLLRISLFGEDSVEGIRRKVQEAYLKAVRRECGEVPPEPDEMLPEIAGRKLVLIFDDLERTNLSQLELLGCVNEYCENLHIKTIIVANEEKLETLNRKKSEGKGSGEKEFYLYSEMKEKLIVRTVRLVMDPARVVEGIVGQYMTSSPAYPAFLRENRHELTALMESSELKNIRSLRCGIQDFERVFELCREEGVEPEYLRRYFSSFVLFTILAKGGRVSRSSMYGYGLNRLQQKYPGHYWDRFMPDCLKDAVLLGNWEEDRIREEIRRTREFCSGTMQAENQLRFLRFLEWDDRTVEAGWNRYCSMAYEGLLTPEEYILLIQNRIAAREYGFARLSELDMEKVEGGVNLALESICRQEQSPQEPSNLSDDEMMQASTDEEERIWRRISDFFRERQYLFGQDRSRIRAALIRRDEQELYRCRRCRTDCFDREMAGEAMEWYRSLEKNQERMEFSDLLLRILSTCGETCSYRSRETLDSLNYMKDELAALQECMDDQPLRKIAARVFSDRLGELAEQWEAE